MEYFIISFKNAFAYKAQIHFKVIRCIISTFVIIAMWKYVYLENMEMKETMVVYTILSNIISLFYSSNIADVIAEKVYKGIFVIELLRPINFFMINFLQVLGQICADFILKGLPICVILGVVYWEYLYRIKLTYIGAAIIIVILAMYLCIQVFSFIGFLAFRYYEVWPFSRLMSDTIRLLSGAIMPLYLLPDSLYNLAMKLPFHFMYAYPIELLLNGDSCVGIVEKIFNIFFWICIFTVILNIIYNKAIKKCVVQGG